jgi:hypothetical protein
MKIAVFIVRDAAFRLEVFSVRRIMVQKKRAAVDSCLYTDFLGRVREIVCYGVIFFLKNWNS